MQDGDLFAVYGLAEHLHKTVGEVLAMSTDEFAGWMAYLQIKANRQG